MKPLVALFAIALLAGCTSTSTSSATVETPSNDNTQLAMCAALVDDALLDPVLQTFTVYATDPESVTQDDIEAAIEKLESLAIGAAGDIAAGYDEMTSVLGDIRERYMSGSETEPAVDYQAFQDGYNEVIDGCVALAEG